MTETQKKLRVPDLPLMKGRGERIVMLTAYDATMARLFDRAGVDMLLVGDSLGHVILGSDTTIPVNAGCDHSPHACCDTRCRARWLWRTCLF